VFPYALPSVLGELRGRVLHTVHNVAEREVGDGLRRSTHWLAFHAMVAPVAICDYASRTIVKTYGVSPRATIPNGVPVKNFVLPPAAGPDWRARNGIPPDAIIFTSVARLTPQKAPVALVGAFAPVAAKHPNALLILVGGGELRAAVEARVRALELDRRVLVLGSREDIPEILAASNVFVLASLFEGHPLSVMEAMAAGLPVVATAVGGVPELVRTGDTGLLVPPSDTGALQSALESLAASDGLRARMGAASREIALAEFDVSRMIEKYDRLYQDILTTLPSRG
jgi:glycosyltransferase involved in cell wall biosynthesis